MGPKECQKHVTHTITPLAAWTADTRPNGSTFSRCLCQILILPSKCWNTFFWSSDVQAWWALLDCSLTFMLLADRSGTTRHFHPESCCSVDGFSFFRPFSINPRDACVGKSQQISSFCNSSPSSPTTMPRSRSLKSAFSCILMPCLNFSRSSWLCRRAWGPAKRLAG